METKIDRRNFIKHVAVGTASLTSFGGVLPAFSAKSYKNIIGANDKILMGAIGVNARGNALAGGFAFEKDCDVIRVCDVDSRAIEQCKSTIEKVSGTKAIGYTDIRKMLEEKDIDAVFIATPDHWHAPAALMAMKAGKHVYVEKPTSHNPAENEIMIEAQKKYNRVVQVGNQRRSWSNVRQAIQELHAGVIGKVSFGKSWYANNRPSIGTGKIVPVPEWLNWDLWQGPAPRVKEYKDNIVHYNWHWFWHWGTGEALNNGTHFVDLLRWGLQEEYPTKVVSVGGRYRFKDDWETPDTQTIGFEFGEKSSMSWEGRSCNSRSVEGESVGCEFYGETGSLIIGGGNTYKVFDMRNKLIKNVESEEGFQAGNLVNPTKNLDAYHFRNFFDAIKKGEKLYSSLRDGCISTLLVQLGNISQRVGRSLNIDPANGHILNDHEANKLWGRDYEKGWEMKA